MSLLKKILDLFKKEEIKEQEVEEKPERIVLSSLPEVPGLQAQTEIVVEDEGVDIDEENPEKD